MLFHIWKGWRISVSKNFLLRFFSRTLAVLLCISTWWLLHMGEILLSTGRDGIDFTVWFFLQLRLMQTELSVEEVIKDRSLKVKVARTIKNCPVLWIDWTVIFSLPFSYTTSWCSHGSRSSLLKLVVGVTSGNLAYVKWLSISSRN